MKRKTSALTLIFALLCFLALLTGSTQSAKAITIYRDGTISGTDKIQRDGNVYTVTGNIFGTIRIDRNNIVLDGGGYTLEGNEIEGNGVGITLMTGRNLVTIRNFHVKGFRSGIELRGSKNRLVNCTLTDCYMGIHLDNAVDNTVSDNFLLNNRMGIKLDFSSDNVFRNNRLDNSTLSIGESWFNSIDSSNTLNGKPIIYLVNEKDLVISPTLYPQVGYLALVKCTGITVTNLYLSDQITYGITLAYTTNSKITQNTITNLWHGIHIDQSYNNNITENYLANNDVGICIMSDSANTITRNIIENNRQGISLEGKNQVFYHNNFINNSAHASSGGWNSLNRMPLPYGRHVWDNGYPSGGNYWTGYNGTDADLDGIGDTPYVVSRYYNNTDNYPLMKPVDVNIDFPSPSPSPTPSPEPIEPELFPAIIVLASVVTVVAVGGGLLVYFKKRNH
jgi:parallel beta-helix repeat protein